jgi:hypothetical protein
MRLRPLANQRPDLFYNTLAPRGTKAMLCVGTPGGEYGGGLREGTLGETTLLLGAEKEGRRASLRPGDGIPQGWIGRPALVYDDEKERFRFSDGRFAFSRDHADWELLRKRGRMKGL